MTIESQDRGPCLDIISFWTGPRAEAREVEPGLWHVYLFKRFCGTIKRVEAGKYEAITTSGESDFHKTVPYAGSWIIKKAGIVKIDLEGAA